MRCKTLDDEVQSLILAPKEQVNQLYHYTTIENLYSILRSRSLWMNSYKNYIDHEEIKHGWDLFFREMTKVGFRKEVIKDIKEVVSLGYFCAITSFSTRVNIPEMWYYYADHFSGVVIEFNNSEVEGKMQKLQNRFNNGDNTRNKKLIAGKVIYDQSNYSAIINKLLLKCKEHIRLCEGVHQFQLIEYILMLLPVSKNEYFEHEKEYRICCLSIANKDESIENEPMPIHFKSEDVIFPNYKDSLYSIIFPFDDKDVSGIYLLDRNFTQSKNNLVEKLKQFTGRDYSDIIKKISLNDDEIRAFKPHRIIID